MSGVDSGCFSERYYYVDEAGDGTLFDAKGLVIIGREGCSRFFLLGALEVGDPARLRQDMDTLRTELLADPWFRRVPSMQAQYGKTAVAFHAKDDCPEVRRDVFRLLQQHDLRFFAVLRDKNAILESVRARNQQDPGYRYNPNEAYDSLVGAAFGGLLHEHAVCHTCFSRRGKSDRTKALQMVLQAVMDRAVTDLDLAHTTQIHVSARWNHEDAGLQATDYFLWAVQRLYERGEDRYLELLWPQFARMLDLDDPRAGEGGMVYTRERPLSLAALRGRPGI